MTHNQVITSHVSAPILPQQGLLQHVHIARKKREREREIQSKRKKASAPIKQNFPRPLTTRKHQINSVYDTDYHPLAPGEEGGG